MSYQKLDQNQQNKLMFDYHYGHNITELANMYSVSRSTIRRYLTSLGVSLPKANLSTDQERQLLKKLAELNITTVKELQAVIEGEPLDLQLMRMNVNEWGSLLYHASVKRHLAVQSAVQRIQQGDPNANSSK